MLQDKFGTVLDIARAANKLLLIAFISSLVAVMILSACLYRAIGQKTVTLVPPVMNQRTTVSAVKPDQAYLDMMARYLLGLKLNITPATVQQNHKLLLNYVNHAHYPQIQKILTEDQQAVQKHDISSVFYPDETTSKVSNLTVRISGTLVKKVGERPLKPSQVTYQLQFSYDNGLLKLNAMNQLKKTKEQS